MPGREIVVPEVEKTVGQLDPGRVALSPTRTVARASALAKPASTRKGSLMSNTSKGTLDSAPISVGIDVSKESLDLGTTSEQQTQSFVNAAEGHAEIIALLRERPVQIIVVEATGKYEAPLVAALAAAQLPVVVVNPRQARDFAKATGQLAKTDAIDARLLARMGEAVKPEIRPLPDEKTRQLQELLARRAQLLQMKKAEVNRQAMVSGKLVRKSLQKVLDLLEKQIKDIDCEIGQRIQDSPLWKEKEDLLKSVPGVGDQTARMLIGELPELGTCSRQQIATLAGVAPFNHDSGKFRGQRSISGGRGSVRSALYMATLVATRHNAQIKQKYQQLLKKGKKKKVAIVACMRKLLTMLNAMLRKKQTWNYSSVALAI